MSQVHPRAVRSAVKRARKSPAVNASRPAAKQAVEFSLSATAVEPMRRFRGETTRILETVAEAFVESERSGRAVRFHITIGPTASDTRIAVASGAKADPLEAALRRSESRGAGEASALLGAADMVSADQFAALIDASRETVHQKRRRGEVLGLEGAKRGVRFPTWQLVAGGRLLPGLPALFETFDGEPWAVYRFLVQAHPELDGQTGLAALKAGRIDRVLATANGIGAGEFSCSMADPPIGFAQRPLVLATLAPGERWRRIYRTVHPDPLGWGPGLNRFSDPTGTLFGVLYLGRSLKVCFAETILRDRADGGLRPLPMATRELNRWTTALATVQEPLTLIDLRGDGPLRMGVPSDVVGARDHGLSRRWSEAFWRHDLQVDGILYPSRLNEERNLALYDRALGKLRASKGVPLLKMGGALAAVLDDLHIALVRTRP